MDIGAAVELLKQEKAVVREAWSNAKVKLILEPNADVMMLVNTNTGELYQAMLNHADILATDWKEV